MKISDFFLKDIILENETPNNQYLQDPNEVKKYLTETLKVLPKHIEKIDDDGGVYIDSNFSLMIDPLIHDSNEKISFVPIKFKQAKEIFVYADLDNFDFLPDEVEVLEIFNQTKEFKLNKKVKILDIIKFMQSEINTLDLNNLEFGWRGKLSIISCRNFKDFSGECESVYAVSINACDSYKKLGKFPKSIVRLAIMKCRNFNTLTGISKKLHFNENDSNLVLSILECPIKSDIFGILKLNKIPKVVYLQVGAKANKAFDMLTQFISKHPEGFKPDELIDFQNSFYDANDEDFEDFAGM